VISIGFVALFPRPWEDEIALTIRTLLRWPPLADAEVIAGEAGLDHEVTWPATLRVRPPAFEPLSGHELALVSLEMLRLLDDSLSLAQLIGRLADRGVAGVVVVGWVDPAAIERAERAQLPLLHLPDSYHFADLGPAVSRVIGELRTRLYQLGVDVHQQLAEVSMAGRGLVGIVERLAHLSGRRTALLDVAGGLIHCATPPEALIDVSALGEVFPPAELLRARLTMGSDNRGEPPTVRIPLSPGEGLIAPVAIREAIVGYLMLLSAVGDFGDDDQVVLARGSMVCALEMAKQEAVTEAERRLRGDFFDDLLGSSVAHESTEALLNRGRLLGYDLQRSYVALAIAPDASERLAGRVGATIDRLAREVSEYLSGRGAIGLVAHRRQAVALFLASDAVGDLSSVVRFAESLRDYLTGPVGISISIGVGSYHPGIAGLRIAYHEAEQAGQIGREFFGPDQVTTFSDLGLYRLLYAFRQSSELAAFCEETLAPLTDYDAKNGTALVETLEAFFRCDASLRTAADALYLHRNSLAYRLRRISEITGLNLDNLEDRFRLQLALKGLRLVRAQATAPAQLVVSRGTRREVLS
jgi:purine catabolism regulator